MKTSPNECLASQLPDRWPELRKTCVGVNSCSASVPPDHGEAPDQDVPKYSRPRGASWKKTV